MKFLLVLLLISLPFAQGSFEEYLKQEERGYKEEELGFQRYLEEINREFEEYKRIVNREYRAFKKEVLRHWDSFEATNRKKWVEYSPDMKTRKVFDFEKGELRIEVVGKASRERIERELSRFVTEDKAEAFKKDVFLSRVERKIRRLKHVKTSSIDKEPVLTAIVFGKQHVSREELKRGIRSLLKKGKVFRKKMKNGKVVTVFKVKLPPKRILRKVKMYKPYVEGESKRWKLSPPLIFAIIHTESYFNPLATSPVPAYGLMQIVPQTAGKDATRLLFGKPVILAPSYLYNARNNIKVGSAYVYLLYYKYLKDIRDPESRLYCAIAAYNTGPGNVARAFTRSRNLKKAIRVINSLTPTDVYKVLLRNLPYRETRDYLRKVSTRIAVYKNLLGKGG